LRQVQSGKRSWVQFTRDYHSELFEGGSFDRRNRTIKNHGQKFTLRLLQELAKRHPVTLMCHCLDNQPHCHSYILKAILFRKV
jgi:uncharacterized protein YeaO (DUF488 family)